MAHILSSFRIKGHWKPTKIRIHSQDYLVALSKTGSDLVSRCVRWINKMFGIFYLDGVAALLTIYVTNFFSVSVKDKSCSGRRWCWWSWSSPGEQKTWSNCLADFSSVQNSEVLLIFVSLRMVLLKATKWDYKVTKMV